MNPIICLYPISKRLLKIQGGVIVKIFELIDKNTFIFDETISSKVNSNSLTEILDEHGYLKNRKSF